MGLTGCLATLTAMSWLHAYWVGTLNADACDLLNGALPDDRHPFGRGADRLELGCI